MNRPAAVAVAAIVRRQPLDSGCKARYATGVYNTYGIYYLDGMHDDFKFGHERASCGHRAMEKVELQV